MSDNNLIVVENLSRNYGNLEAVNDVSFVVKRGEVLGFLGPNGAGKSTTMSMICGNLAPTSGRITINGLDILDSPRQAKAHIGYLPEQPPLYRELTVDEYLKYSANLNRINRCEIAVAMEKAKQRCGLMQVGGRLVGNLSKGFQQRVGIAQAIIHSPAVVVLDEPTVGLDPIQIREIRALICDLGREHSVILSTHILPEVQMLCNRVQIMHQGRLVLSDSIEGLQRRMQSSSMLVAFQNSPDEQVLENIEGVEEVETLDVGRFRIHYLPENNPVETLVESAVNHCWALSELTPEKMSLEQVFVDITRAEVDEPMKTTETEAL